MDADQVALEAIGERDGAVEHALGVLLVLQNGNDGFEAHGDPSSWRAFSLASKKTSRRRAWFRVEQFQDKCEAVFRPELRQLL
ncbi:hypothetical protein MesoLj113b_43270 [Mesorhizobium sp. 113-3-3]|nr:hypothetical protein MesoLj113b_43270 [Mesorhizobium sp. 113-3-3]